MAGENIGMPAYLTWSLGMSLAWNLPLVPWGMPAGTHVLPCE